VIQFERKYTVAIRERKGLFMVLADLLDACIPFAVEVVDEVPVVEWQVTIPEHWRSFLVRPREIAVQDVDGEHGFPEGHAKTATD
jgi:hypothetical protein